MGLIGTIILSMYHGWPLVLMSPMHFVQEPRQLAAGDQRLSGFDHCRAELLARPVCGCAGRQRFRRPWTCLPVRELYCGAEPIHAETLARFQQATAPLGFDDYSADSVLRDGRATLFVAGKQPRFPVLHDTCP